MMPACGFTTDESTPRRCRFIGRKVEGAVCDHCSHNPASPTYRQREPLGAETLAARLAICRGCEVEHAIRDMRPMFVTVTVKCAACTTCEGGRSLLAVGQTCPLKKW